MIGEVEVTGSPLTDAVMNCLYGPHSPKKSQALEANTEASSFKEKLKSLAESAVEIDMGDEAEDPFGTLVFEDESINDSILYDILNEENEGFLADIEIVGLLPLEFWEAEGQPKELEGDVFVEEAE